jgi:hypothetical protein
MLSLDGGGIRGILTLQVVVEIENQLRTHYGAGDDFRLCDFFDYIGGTSTGAIIAAALALGKSAREVLDFYDDFGAEAFVRRKWYELLKSLYGDGALRQKLQDVYGMETDLTPNGLRTLLLVVTRNLSTDSAWPVSSNPAAKYNAQVRADCNLRIPLWQLVRASAAAPIYFPPETVNWDPKDRDKSFVFVDGGTTPFNNPAFLMYRMATEPAYRLCWKRGERNLLIVSLGTGSAPHLGATAEDDEPNLAQAGLNTLKALMGQAAVEQDVNCRIVGRCTHGTKLDREVSDLIPRRSWDTQDAEHIPLSEDQGRAFLYARYDAELTEQGLASLGLRNIQPENVRKLDSTDSIEELKEIGRALATTVSLDHFGSFTHLPLSTSTSQGPSQ